MLLAYPTDLPVEAFTTIVKAAKDGFSDPKPAVNAAWNILGYGAKVTVGDPNAVTGNLIASQGPPDEGPEMTDDEILAKMEAVSSAGVHDRQMMGAFPIPIKTLIKFAIKIITEALLASDAPTTV